MQRSRRSSHGISDYSVDDDHEMEAMAKVWAHPEDLHLFPVREHALMGCHSLPLLPMMLLACCKIALYTRSMMSGAGICETVNKSITAVSSKSLHICVLLQGMEGVDSKLQRDSVDASHQGKSRRSSMGSNLWRETRNAFLRSQTSGVPAFSLVPLAKVSAINAELSQKIYSLPAAPGATTLSAALAIVGMQVTALSLLCVYKLSQKICELQSGMYKLSQACMPTQQCQVKPMEVWELLCQITTSDGLVVLLSMPRCQRVLAGVAIPLAGVSCIVHCLFRGEYAEPGGGPCSRGTSSYLHCCGSHPRSVCTHRAGCVCHEDTAEAHFVCRDFSYFCSMPGKLSQHKSATISLRL